MADAARDASSDISNTVTLTRAELNALLVRQGGRELPNEAWMAMLTPTPHAQPPMERSAQPCFDFARGTCTRGDACRFSHPKPQDAPQPAAPPPTTPTTQQQPRECRFYAEGTCRRGASCPWAHNEEARRTRERGRVRAGDRARAELQQRQEERQRQLAALGWTTAHQAAWMGDAEQLQRIAISDDAAILHSVTIKQYDAEWSEYDGGDRSLDRYRIIFPPGTTPLDVAESNSRQLYQGYGYETVAVTQYLADSVYGREKRALCIAFLRGLEA